MNPEIIAGKIVAGVGCRAGTASAELLALIDRALDEANLEPSALAALAAPDFKGAEAGLAEAASRLGVPLLLQDRVALEAVAPLCPTRSDAAERAHGIASIAEGAALAAAGPGARLVLPRIHSRAATCALAQRADPPLEEIP